MSVHYADADTAVEGGELDGLPKRIPARVVALPFYDPDKQRPMA